MRHGISAILGVIRLSKNRRTARTESAESPETIVSSANSGVLDIQRCCFFDKLPTEIVVIIARLLGPSDAACLSLTCKGLYRVIDKTTLVQDVFGMRSTVIQDPVSGTPLVVPIGRHRSSGAIVTHAAPAAAE